MILVNDPDKYTPNNIEFRINSSKLLENFKATQHFVLTEMQYGQYNFSRTSKEITLLYCDVMFKTLLLVEKMYIEAKQKTVDEELADKVISLLKSQLKHIIDTTSASANENIFEKRHVELWRSVHFPLNKIMSMAVRSTIGETLAESFKKLVLVIIDSMDSVRFEQNEIDYLIKNGSMPFLNIVDLCAISASYIKEPILVTRAKKYNEFMGKEMAYRVKNYTSSYSSYKICIQGLEQAGIKIIKNKGKGDVSS